MPFRYNPFTAKPDNIRPSEYLSLTTITDPAINEAVSTSNVDTYGGVIITLTGAGNAQTIQNPTDVTLNKRFTVINNDTSTDTITVDGIILSPGDGKTFLWDGSAWIPVSIGATVQEGTTEGQSLYWNNTSKEWNYHNYININNSSGVNYIDLNTSYSNGSNEGRLQWNTDDGVPEIGLPGGNVNLQIGQETILKVKNDESVQINNGQLVYIFSGTGSQPTVKLANASNQTAPKIVAMATEDIGAGQFGYVTVFGLVRDIPLPTATYTAGDKLYLAASDGGYTNVKLDHPNLRMSIGYVIRAHNTEGVALVVVDGDQWLKRFQSSKLIYGFDYDQPTLRGDISFTDGTRTFSIAPQGGESYFNYWIKGQEYRVESEDTVVIDDTSGVWYIYYEGETLTASQTPWTFTSEFAFIAIVYWNATNNLSILFNERHLNNIPRSVHEYLHDSVGARYASGMAGTFDDTTLTIESGEFYDEDISHTNAQQTTAKVLYYNGASEWSWDVLSTPYKVVNPGVDNTLQYNNGTTLTSVDNSKYTCSWVYMTGDEDDPVHIYIDDAQYLTVALARAAEPRSRTDLTSPEDKFIYKVIYQNSGGTPNYIETIDYRSDQNLGSTYTPTDHGTLSGLSDDDHIQYALLAGRNGGQTLIGGIASSDNLTLQSTSNATKGKILFGTSGYDEVNNKLGILTTTPDEALHVLNGAIKVGYSTDTFDQLIEFVRGGTTIGTIDNSSGNLRLKALNNNSVYVINDSNKGLYVDDTGVVNIDDGGINLIYDGSNYTTLDTDSSGYLIITPTSGRVGIGRTPTKYSLEVTGAFYSTSDLYTGGESIRLNNTNTPNTASSAVQFSRTGGGGSGSFGTAGIPFINPRTSTTVHSLLIMKSNGNEGWIFSSGGGLHMEETTTPTAISGYGAIYTKSDNKLYFQDGGGTEHEIAFV